MAFIRKEIAGMLGPWNPWVAISKSGSIGRVRLTKDDTVDEFATKGRDSFESEASELVGSESMEGVIMAAVISAPKKKRLSFIAIVMLLIIVIAFLDIGKNRNLSWEQ